MAWILRRHYIDGLGRSAYTESRFTKRANLDRALDAAERCGDRTEIREVADRPRRRSLRDQIAADLGLVKVRGAVSGKVYYE